MKRLIAFAYALAALLVVLTGCVSEPLPPINWPVQVSRPGFYSYSNIESGGGTSGHSRITSLYLNEDNLDTLHVLSSNSSGEITLMFFQIIDGRITDDAGNILDENKLSIDLSGGFEGYLIDVLDLVPGRINMQLRFNLARDADIVITWDFDFWEDIENEKNDSND